MCIDPKIFGNFGPKINFSFCNCIFWQQGVSAVYSGLQISHWDHPEKNDHFGPVPIAIISTLNFGLCSTKLGGTVQATKKITHNDKGPGPGRDYGETAVFTFCRKAEIGPNIRFILKKTPKIG